MDKPMDQPMRKLIPTQPRTMLRLGALLGALGVCLGAFGAHLIADRMMPADLARFETAVRYQLWHALAICLCAALHQVARRPGAAALCFGAGTVLFSGSLYLLVLFGASWLGAVAPVGGALLIAGWVLLVI